MSQIKFFRLTHEQYNALENKDADAIYFITDSKIVIMGGHQYSHKAPGAKPPLKNPYIHPHYDYVARLDQENSMEFAGYFAEGVKRMELWLVTDGTNGNISISVGGKAFTVPVNPLLSHITLNFDSPLTGRIIITRNMESVNDTLEGKTVHVVDWKLFQGE